MINKPIITDESTCWGCKNESPGQLAHMSIGGCLYSPNRFNNSRNSNDSQNSNGSQDQNSQNRNSQNQNSQSSDSPNYLEMHGC